MMFSTECTPLCPFRAFKCTKNALCEWTGDRCIGWRCQFAVCMRHALLLDGTCSLMVQRKEQKPPIDEEAAKLATKYPELGKKLKRMGLDVEGEV